METVAELERKLGVARKREARAAAQCSECDGAGWISDTTYDRTGVPCRCGRCHGSGLPKGRVDDLITEAMAGFVKPCPASK